MLAITLNKAELRESDNFIKVYTDDGVIIFGPDHRGNLKVWFDFPKELFRIMRHGRLPVITIIKGSDAATIDHDPEAVFNR